MKKILLCMFIILCSNILFAQGLKNDIKKNWRAELKEKKEIQKDTIVLYQSSEDFTRNRVYYRFWTHIDDHYNRVDKDERNGAISDISNTIVENWKVVYKSSKPYLVIDIKGNKYNRVKKNKVVYKLIPDYVNGSLKKITLIKVSGDYY